MRDKELKKELAQILHKEMPEIDETHLEKTVSLAQCVYRERKCRQRIEFGGLLLRQLKFMGWRVWGLQVVSLLLILTGFHTLFGNVEFVARHITSILCALAIMMVWAVTPIIARSFKYKMYEIENTSLFSGSRLLIAQMMIIIGGVLLMFLAMLWFTSVRYMYGFSELAFSLILPFFASGNLYLYLLRHIRPQKLIKVCNVAGVILMAVIIFLDRRKALSLIELPTATGWGLCFLGIVFCVIQMKLMWEQKIFGSI